MISKQQTVTMVRERLNQRRAARGFTLIELIISMAAGLLISAAAFLLARNASTFFENESRISAAQFATTLGMTRLQDDLRRASFMTSPNVQNDPRLCGSQTGWPAGMSALAGIRITTPAATGLSALNGLSPDRLVLSGAFGTTEQFAVQSLSQGTGGTTTVMLQNDGAMARTLQSVAAGSMSHMYQAPDMNQTWPSPDQALHPRHMFYHSHTCGPDTMASDQSE